MDKQLPTEKAENKVPDKTSEQEQLMEDLAGKSAGVAIYEEEKSEAGEIQEEDLFIDDTEDYPYWDEDEDNDGN